MLMINSISLTRQTSWIFLNIAAFQNFKVSLLLPHACEDFATKKLKDNSDCKFAFCLNCKQRLMYVSILVQKRQLFCHQLLPWQGYLIFLFLRYTAKLHLVLNIFIKFSGRSHKVGRTGGFTAGESIRLV